MSAENSPSIEGVLARLADRSSLRRDEARQVMSTLLRGEVSAAQTGAFLMGLRSKGETEEEVAGLLEAMREAGIDVEYRKYQHAGHGFGLGIGTDAEGWIEHAIRFWENHISAR